MTHTCILVIDDSEADQFLFKLLVEERYPELNIIQAYDGQQAHEILTTTDLKPDIIFLDINMPRMNGYEFLDATQDIIIEKNAKVFMLTSSNQDSDKAKALDYTCVKGYVEKPFGIEPLEKALTLN
ncbi:MAG: CheY-like chemotaxis protein [Cellvibrionaceae bacterium]|jgi:CheY-like chemotaxis protein